MVCVYLLPDIKSIIHIFEFHISSVLNVSNSLLCMSIDNDDGDIRLKQVVRVVVRDCVGKCIMF